MNHLTFDQVKEVERLEEMFSMRGMSHSLNGERLDMPCLHCKCERYFDAPPGSKCARYECHVCGGSGTVLTEAGADLIDFLFDHLEFDHTSVTRVSNVAPRVWPTADKQPKESETKD